MPDKTNFWAVLLAPWRPKNTLRFGFYILVGTSLIFAQIWVVNYLASGQVPSIPSWWLFFPVAFSALFMLTFRIVGLLVENLSKKLPEGALLRSHCLVIHGILETPGLAQITPDQLLIKPLVGSQISVPLSKIAAITEHRWYNGRPYLGTTVFFKLKVPDTVSDKWRLGFGVEDGGQWRKLLYTPSKVT